MLVPKWREVCVVVVWLAAAAAASAGCGAGSGDGGSCPGPGVDLLAQVDQFAMDHNQCQQVSDCVAVGVFVEACDTGQPNFGVAVNPAAADKAKALIDEAAACDQLPTPSDLFYCQDVSCAQGHCQIGIYNCFPPPPPDAPAHANLPDARPDASRDASPEDGGSLDARVTDAAP